MIIVFSVIRFVARRCHGISSIILMPKPSKMRASYYCVHIITAEEILTLITIRYQ